MPSVRRVVLNGTQTAVEDDIVVARARGSDVAMREMRTRHVLSLAILLGFAQHGTTKRTTRPDVPEPTPPTPPRPAAGSPTPH